MIRNNDDVRKIIEDSGYAEGGVVIFEDPDYAPAFVGVTHDDRAVYDYRLMVRYLMDSHNMSEDEAVEFISYNTIRALDYIGKGPVVIIPLETQ